MEKLLPYYECELSLLRGRLRDVARRFPRLAELFGLSGERCSDAGVERLVQVAAFLYARLVRKIERGHQRFTIDLLSNQTPFYLRPIPACSVIQVDGTGGPATAAFPRGTELHAKAAAGCGFRTAYDVAIAPITVSVRFTPRGEAPGTAGLPKDVGCGIAITIETTDPSVTLEVAAVSPLRIFIDAEGPARTALQDAIFMHTLCTCVESGGEWRKLPALPFTLPGFARTEALLPTPWNQEESLRLLTEYFAFPEKFDFVDIDLKAALAACPAGTRRLALHVLLPDMHHTTMPNLLRMLPPTALRLGCTPVINMFSRPAAPIRLRKGRNTYPLTFQRSSGADTTVYSIDAMRLLHDAQGGGAAIDMEWFYHRKFATQHCWVFELADAVDGTQDTVSLVNRMHEPLDLGEGSVAVQVTCTNGDLPCAMAIGRVDGDLADSELVGSAPIRMLRKPSAQLSIADEPEGHWHLIAIAHASNRDRAQYHLPALLDLLRMHARPDSAVAARQLAGIVGVSRRVVPVCCAWHSMRACH